MRAIDEATAPPAAASRNATAPAAAAAAAARLSALIAARPTELLSPDAGDARCAAATRLLSLLTESLPAVSAGHSTGGGTAGRAPVLLRARQQRAQADSAAEAPLPPPLAAANAWRAAGGALRVVLRFEEPEVVAAVVEFFRATGAALLGSPPADVPAGAPAADADGDAAARFVAWLWRCSPELLAEAVGRAHDFWALTGISALRRAAAANDASLLPLLLTVLQLTDGGGAAAQLVELAWGVNAAAAAAAQAGAPAAAAMTQVLGCGDAFAAVARLLQLSAGDANTTAWEARAGAGLARRAAAFLWAGYSGATGPPVAGMGAQRPPFSAYDLCMVRLLASLVASVTGGSAAVQHGSTKGRRAKAPPATARGSEAACALAFDGAAPGARALALLVASHPRWDVLLRGLIVALEADAAAAATSGSAPAPPISPAAVLGVLSAIARAAAAAGDAGADVADTGASADGDADGAAPRAAACAAHLLFALASLARPDAGCGAEWRAEALAEMGRAAAWLEARHPEAPEALLATLWGPATLDALLCCLLYDPSVKARRAAVALVAAVALPGASPAAAALARALATKARDRHARVAVGALELLLQIPFGFVAAALDPSALRACLAAALQACAASAAATAATSAATQGDGQVIGPEARAAFLETVSGLLAPTAPNSDNSAGVASAAGRALVALLHDASFAASVEAVAAHCERERQREQRREQEQQRESAAAASRAARDQAAAVARGGGARRRRRAGGRRRQVVGSSSDDGWESSDGAEEESEEAEEEGEEQAEEELNADDDCVAASDSGSGSDSGAAAPPPPPPARKAPPAPVGGPAGAVGLALLRDCGGGGGAGSGGGGGGGAVAMEIVYYSDDDGAVF